MSIDPHVFSAFADELRKIASGEVKEESPYWRSAKILGSGALGFGAGTAAGLLAGYGADKLYGKVTGSKIPKELIYGAVPLLGGAAGIAYSVYKAKEQEAIKRALENRKESGAG